MDDDVRHRRPDGHAHGRSAGWSIPCGEEKLRAPGRPHVLFAVLSPTPDGILVDHHSISRSGPVYFAPLKRAAVDGEGTLRLAWWQGNEKLKHQPIAVAQPGAPAVGDPSAAVMLDRVFGVEQGLVLEGVVTMPSRASEKPYGLRIEHGTGEGTAILVRPGGITEIGTIRPDGSKFKVEDRANREAPFGRTARFRLLLKQSLVEFYLDDLLMHCHSLPQVATGRIGLFFRRERRSDHGPEGLALSRPGSGGPTDSLRVFRVLRGKKLHSRGRTDGRPD